ncbi:RNA polymerase sigma factor [Zhouia spongiae]|uniref:RNA polymerase sigma factor n=1 Tax=Zhouia spongiae TaxID=2202721 RepID=A0ABY3YR10_9FLAO|nr:RNA polymerase sigma factor [Zhouia spongiae]UNZ00290.1 RNA polymerase sigma factor [Zhouia spongiae]
MKLTPYKLINNPDQEAATVFREEELIGRDGYTGNYDALKDPDLWKLFLDGDEGAFVKIYNDYFFTLCNFGIQYTNIEVVKDAVQDMFIDLRKKRRHLPKIKKSLKLFLFQCLKRRLLNILKKQSRLSVPDKECEEFGFHKSHEEVIILNQGQKQDIDRLENALGRLNKKQREVIYYYFYQGMGYEEIQDLMGFDNIKSARNLVYKIIKTLRKGFIFLF